MSGTQPQHNSGTTKEDDVERTESGAIGKDHKHPENKHEAGERD
jgi:hypothetical protein